MMKNWKKMIVTASALASLALFAGCTTASAVSLDEARELVQEHMGAKDAVVIEQETDREDGVYELEIIIDGVGYEFEVDSRTGDIREAEREDDHVAAVQSQPAETRPVETRPAETKRITLEEAKAIAYAHAGVSEADAYDKSYERDDGVYEIDFEHGGWEYDYDIAPDGTILRAEKEPEQAPAAAPAETKPAQTEPAQSDRITAQEALAIALAHAGVTDARDRDVEWDDGRWEVSFESGRTEYEYELRADGTIVHWETEHED